MKRTTKIAIAVFALFFAAGTMFAQDSFNLKFKFEKGKTYLYRTVTNTEQVINAMGTEINTSALSKTKIRFEIADVTPAQIEAVLSFDSLYSKSSSPQGDTENTGEGVIGKKTKYLYDNLGKKLKKIEIDVIKTETGQDYSSAANLFMQLAEKPMKIGESWSFSRTDTSKQGEDGKMITKSDIECKIEGKENKNGVDCLKISFNSKSKTEGAMTQGGMNIVMEGTGKTSGFFYFDYSKGIMTYTESTTDMDINAAIPEQSVTIPITNKVKATVLLTEK